MKNLFKARSPFWQLITYTAFFFAAVLIALRPDITSPSQLELNNFLSLAAVVILFLIGLAQLVTILRYNRRHPQTPIRYYGIFPPELHEQDEGMRSFTAKATRKVYIFHAIFLPIFAIIFALLNPPNVLVIAGLAFLVLGHFTIYLITIWPVLQEEGD